MRGNYPKIEEKLASNVVEPEMDTRYVFVPNQGVSDKAGSCTIMMARDKKGNIVYFHASGGTEPKKTTFKNLQHDSRNQVVSLLTGGAFSGTATELYEQGELHRKNPFAGRK